MHSPVSSRELACSLSAALEGAQYAADVMRLAARAGFVPDPWQLRVLTSPAQTILLNCSRQSGKSTVLALLVCWYLVQPCKLVVIITPSLRQSKELMRKVLAFWRRLGRPVAHVAATRTTLELANESRLEAFPGNSDTIVGISAVDLLIADEASRIPDELYNAVAPMLAVSNGRLLAPSTPRGKRGWWYALWETPAASDPDIGRELVPATDCPRISAAFLARERRRIGEWWYRQEYGCEFLETATAAFREQDIDAAFRSEVPFAEWLFEESA